MKNSHVLIAILAVCVVCGFLSEGIMRLALRSEPVAEEETAVQRRIRLKDLEAGEKKQEIYRKDREEDAQPEDEPRESVPMSGSAEDEEDLREDTFLWDGGYLRAYYSLGETEQIWYNDIANALGTMTDNVKLSQEGLTQGLDEKDVDRIFQYVLDDHPELFYVEGYSCTRYTRAQKTVAIEFTGTYSMDHDMAASRWQEISDEVDRILAGAPQSRDDYTKVKYAYETIILNTDYDEKAPDNQNIYSVFVGRRSVCQGYAKAFQYLLNRMDVECTLVQGTVAETEEGHAWNLIRADGGFYYVDTTWGDVSYRNADENPEGADNPIQISYDYLCITTEQLLRTHTPEEKDKLPICTATADNYYVRENALFSEYDKEQMKQLVNRNIFEENGDVSADPGEAGDTIRAGEITISLRCSDENCYKAVCTALLDEREFFDYLAGTGITSFVYSCNDKQYTLTFFMVTSTKQL